MTDIPVGDVPDDVIAALDANARREGRTGVEYLRRVLAEERGPAITRGHVDRLAARTADLADTEVMASAWQ